MPATYKLKGKVTDSAGTGIPHATVKIVGGMANFGKTATTDASGKYTMAGVKPEKIIIEASVCFNPKDKMLTVSGNTTVDFKLTTC